MWQKYWGELSSWIFTSETLLIHLKSIIWQQSFWEKCDFIIKLDKYLLPDERTMQNDENWLLSQFSDKSSVTVWLS